MTLDDRRRVLVLAPHPDDEVFIAATLLAHIARSDSVSIVIATDGRRSRQRDLDEKAMAALRRSEAESTRDLIGAESWSWIGLPDVDFEEDDLVAQLRPILRDFRPDLVYAPSRVDGHPDHRRCARALARSLEIDSDVVVRCYSIQIPLTPILVNRALDTSDFEGQALAVMEAYASQRGSWERSLRMRRYAAALYGGRTWVDEFWEMSADAYRRVHACEDDDSTWQGLRPNAFRDPVVYLSGLRARRAFVERRGR